MLVFGGSRYFRIPFVPNIRKLRVTHLGILEDELAEKKKLPLGMREIAIIGILLSHNTLSCLYIQSYTYCYSHNLPIMCPLLQSQCSSNIPAATFPPSSSLGACSAALSTFLNSRKEARRKSSTAGCSPPPLLVAGSFHQLGTPKTRNSCLKKSHFPMFSRWVEI